MTGAELHILEPNPDGHRMQYVRRLVAQTAPDIKIVLSTFPSSRDHAAFKQVLAVGHERLEVKWIAGEEEFKTSIAGKDGFSLHPAYWRLFRKHWKSLKALPEAQVIVPYLDYCSYAIGVIGSPFGKNRFSGIVMRPDFHWMEMGVKAPVSKLRWLKKSLILRLLRNRHLHRLVTIDPSLNDWVQRLKPIGLEKLVYVVDPSDLKGTASRSDARLHFGLPDHAKVVLMFGNIDQRKGVRGLMELLAHTDTPTDIVGLIVGKQSEIAREMIARACIPSQRLVTLDHYVGAEDEWLSFQAADWIWVAYEGFFGPSGVLAQAAQLGKPVIHNGLGLIGYAFAKCEGNKINPNLANLMLSGPMEMQKSSVEFCNLVKIAIADDCKLAQVE